MSTTNKELFLQRAKTYFEEDYERFINELDKKASSGFFINSKKGLKEDILKLVDFEYTDSPFNENSYYHNYDSIGKTKVYELGLIYPQDVESCLPAFTPDVSDVKLAIDLCAAPGGKSINILNRLADDALLISNEINYKRAGALVSNLERMGLSNVMITNLKPETFTKQFSGCFDLVLLDAPCSGEGMIRKYPEIMDNYNLGNITDLASVQSDLLDTAYKLLKKGGQLVYSTCTYAFEEDEDQINNFLNKYSDMELIELSDFKDNKAKLKGTLKYSPITQSEGQYIALLRKNEGDIKTPKYRKTVKNQVVEKFIKNNINIDKYYLYSIDNRYYLSLTELLDIRDHILNMGVYLGELVKDRFEPSHSLYRSNQLFFKNVYDLNDDEYLKFINGQEIDCNNDNAYYQVSYNKYSLGFGKLSNGKLKNKYPKGLRRVV
ncbi:MAG: RsmF rRNA methyltransferase first C-terminal domain-containing protein [Erysipelotrichaceae bacterium]|nr:RsmF rRNA methyltransferase first C-terminal domain-containing protein [Erysipelotrichaceae bacterium]